MPDSMPARPQWRCVAVPSEPVRSEGKLANQAISPFGRERNGMCEFSLLAGPQMEDCATTCNP